MASDNQCPPFSLITSLIILLSAGLLQAVQGYPDALTVTFLLVGVTSVIHHSRLDDWWKYDVWRVLDYIAILMFVTAASLRFRTTLLWPALCAIVFSIQSLIWLKVIDGSAVSAVHACMHLIVCAFMLLLCFLARA